LLGEAIPIPKVGRWMSLKCFTKTRWGELDGVIDRGRGERREKTVRGGRGAGRRSRYRTVSEAGEWQKA